MKSHHVTCVLAEKLVGLFGQNAGDMMRRNSLLSLPLFFDVGLVCQGLWGQGS